jgi:hypothetical protein
MSNDLSRFDLEPIFVSNTTTTFTHAQTSKVNTVQSTSSQQPRGKKKNKGKSNKSSNEQNNPNTVDTQPNRKVKFPFIICEEYHYMKDYPHCEAITKFLKDSSQLVQQQHLVAKNPTPLQGGNAGHSHHGDTSPSAFEVYMFKVVNVMTQVNNYETLTHDQGNVKSFDHPSHPLLLHLPILFRLRSQFLMQCCTFPRV